jgi:hypothetical protein
VNNCRSLIQQDLALLAESRAAAFQHLDEAEEVLQAGPISEEAHIEQLARTLRIRAGWRRKPENLKWQTPPSRAW